MSKLIDNSIVDLFAGTGGFGFGAQKAGFNFAYAFDKDRDLTFSIKKNFSGVTIFNIDLAELSPKTLMKMIDIKKGQIAGVIGGPPCQGFSYVGKRDPNDPRNHLVVRFFHYVKVIEPHFFLMENVPGLLNNPFRNFLDCGLDMVSSKFRILPPLILNAADFGAATSRSRVFVLGYRSEFLDPINEGDLKNNKSILEANTFDAFHDLSSLDSAVRFDDGDYWGGYKSDPLTEYARIARGTPVDGFSNTLVRKLLKEGKVSGFQPTKHSLVVLERFSKLAPGAIDKVSRCKRLDWNELAPSLRAGTGRDHGSFQSLRPIHPSDNRVISVREAARLQGFPDWFQFHPTKWHSFRMIGNSVSPFVANHLFSQIARKMMA